MIDTLLFPHFGAQHKHFQDDDPGSPWSGDYINYLCDWVPDLRWALIPLEGERGWSIFAAAHEGDRVVTRVEMEFMGSHIPMAYLVEDSPSQSVGF